MKIIKCDFCGETIEALDLARELVLTKKFADNGNSSMQQYDLCSKCEVKIKNMLVN